MTVPGSGLSSSFGTAIETTYGTFVVPTRWNAVESAEIKRAPTYAKGNGLRGGKLVRSKNDRALTNCDAAGPIKSNVYYNGMGQLFGSLMGSLNVAPVVLTAPAYTQTHVWANSQGQSLSIQQGIVDVNQASHNWQTYGAKVSDAQFECTVGQGLMAQWAIDAQDHFEVAGAIATPTEPAGDPFFSWANMAVKIGAFGAEAKVDGVRKWTGTFKRLRDNKRFNAGNLTINPNIAYGIKDEPVDNGFQDIGGTLETEYLNDSLYETYFQTETPFSLIVVFTSTVNASTGHPYSISFNFPCCYFTGDDPTVNGPDLVKPSMPFEVWDDETHPVATVTIVNTDVTL